MASRGKLTPLKELRSKYGRPETEYLDTGIFLLNDLIGGTGFPTGKWIEFHAAEGIGKTTLAVQIVKHIIKKFGVKVMYLDTEGRLDESLRNSIGVSMYENDDEEYPSFLYMCPGTYSEIALCMAQFIESGYTWMVWDSVANASVGISADDDEKIISTKLGQDAYQQTQLMKAFRNKFSRVGKNLIVINQMRANIETNPVKAKYAKDLKPSGGKSYDHNLDIRIGMTRSAWIEDKDGNKTGSKVKLTTIKNTVGVAFRQVEVDLIFGKGVDKTSTLMQIMENKGVIDQSGGWFKIGEEKFQGRENLKAYIRNNYNDCLGMIGNYVKTVDTDGKELKTEDNEDTTD